VVSHHAIDYTHGRRVARLVASVAGYPDWVVEVLVTPTSAGPAATDLRIYPVQLRLDIDGVDRRDERNATAPTPTVAAKEKRSKKSRTDPSDRALPPAMPTGLTAKIDLRELVSLADQCAASKHHRNHARPGRKGHGIDHYLLWAGRYATTVASGVRQPIAALAAEYGEDRNYIRDTVNDARHRHGLLTDPGQGCAGGQLTNKARQLMAGSPDDMEN
jgi:hypothetical protein